MVKEVNRGEQKSSNFYVNKFYVNVCKYVNKVLCKNYYIITEEFSFMPVAIMKQKIHPFNESFYTIVAFRTLVFVVGCRLVEFHKDTFPEFLK